MADSRVADATPPAPDTPATSGLLDQALALTLDHIAAIGVAQVPWRFGPVVIVSPAEHAASAAVVAAAHARGMLLDSGSVAFRPGHDLNLDIAAALAADRSLRLASELGAGRLVVVDRVDRVASDDHRQVLVQLLEETVAAGGVWVVSTPTHPAVSAGSRLDSRLCAGLVVPLAARPVRQVQAGTAPSLTRIVRAAARLHDVQPAAIVGPSRSRTVAAARGLAMYLARRLTPHSLQAIGAGCGGRDHSTVLHGVRVCMAKIARDPAFATEVDLLIAHLGMPAAGHVTSPTPRSSSVGSAALAGKLRGRRRGRRRLA